MKIKTFLSLALISLLTACGGSKNAAENTKQSSTSDSSSQTSIKDSDEQSKPNIVLVSDIKWDQLNPARGDKSPMAGTIWGDRKGKKATGFIFKPVDGFKSPPHIHNVSYRGIVISGVVHNDDPNADEMWMPAGSFWTQPKGKVHITAAKGTNTMAYIEIEEGPYLVWPVDQAFDDGEQPINVAPSNLVWLDASNTAWIAQANSSNVASGAKIAFLWGKPQSDDLNVTLIKLPAGFTGKLSSKSATFRAVVIQGQLQHQASEKILDPGSSFSSKGASVHQVSTKGEKECLIYVRTKGKFTIIPSHS